MRYHTRSRGWIAAIIAPLVVLLVAMAAFSVRAQGETTPIAIGDTAKGTITENDYRHLYSLKASTGDAVTISMIASGSLDPYLLLEDSDGHVLAANDDSAGGRNAQITFTFPKDGSYIIIATRFGQLSGPTSGDYTLTVKAGSTNATVAPTEAATAVPTTRVTRTATTAPTEPSTEQAVNEATEAPTAEPPTATLKPSRTPRPTATEVVAEAVPTEEVNAEPTSEPTEEASVTPTRRPTRTRTPRPTPTEVATEAASTEEVNAEPTSEPTEEATATPTRRPTRTPRPTPTEVVTEEVPTDEPTVEEPTVTSTPRRAPTKRPTKAAPTATPDVIVDAGPISDGDSLTGEITDAKVFYLYIYEGAAGEQITVTVTTDGSLTPSATVISPQTRKSIKTVVAADGESKLTLSVTLPADGRYVLVVTRAGNSAGTSSGSFTVTLSANNAASQIDISGGPAKVIAGLRTANLVPKGGKQLFTLPPNSFTRVSTPGFRFLPVANNAPAQNFVLNFQVSWNTAGTTSACGMGFWRSSNQDAAFILLTNDNKVALLQFQGKNSPINYYADSTLFSPGDVVTVTVIAVNDQVTLYLNGKLQTSQKGQGVKGTFELETFNPKGNTTVTNCRFPSGWVWSFD